MILRKSRHTENRSSRNERLLDATAERVNVAVEKATHHVLPAGGRGIWRQARGDEAYVEGRTSPQAPLPEPGLTPKSAVAAREPGAG